MATLIKFSQLPTAAVFSGSEIVALTQGALSVGTNLATMNSYYSQLTTTLTNKSVDGSANTLTNIPNSALVNNSVTVAGQSVALGGSTAISAANLSDGVSGTGSIALTNSPTFVTPSLGTPSALVGTNITGTAAGLTAGYVTTNANLTGEVVSVGNATTMSNSAVIGKVLTGYSPAAGIVVATDSILAAIQKVDGNTIALATSVSGSLNYKGVWNASTNTPTLVSGTGTKGWYYKVSVAGSTSIDGISQWNQGDVIAYNGTTWDKIDGLGSEVVSVVGQVGVVTASQISAAISGLNFNTSGTAGTVTNAAQPNITSVGTLTGLTTSAAINVNGFSIGNGGGTDINSVWIGRYTTATGNTGGFNTVIGKQSATTLTSGGNNTLIGASSNGAITTGTNNSTLGNNVLGANTTGSYLTAVGYQTGGTGTYTNTTGNNNTWLGAFSGPGTTTQLSNATAIGYGATNLNSNEMVLGNSSLTSVTTAAAITAGGGFIGHASLDLPLTGGTLSGSLSVPHIVGNSTPPSITAGASAGTSPTVSVTGTDLAFSITITTGTSPAASGVIATVTFNTAYGSSPKKHVTPTNASAASLSGANMVYPTSTTTTFVLNANTTALSASTTYTFDVICVQ